MENGLKSSLATKAGTRVNQMYVLESKYHLKLFVLSTSLALFLELKWSLSKPHTFFCIKTYGSPDLQLMLLLWKLMPAPKYKSTWHCWVALNEGEVGINAQPHQLKSLLPFSTYWPTLPPHSPSYPHQGQKNLKEHVWKTLHTFINLFNKIWASRMSLEMCYVVIIECWLQETLFLSQVAYSLAIGKDH